MVPLLFNHILNTHTDKYIFQLVNVLKVNLIFCSTDFFYTFLSTRKRQLDISRIELTNGPTGGSPATTKYIIKFQIWHSGGECNTVMSRQYNLTSH